MVKHRRRARLVGLLLAGGLAAMGLGPVGLTTAASAADPDYPNIATASLTLGGHPVVVHFNDPATDHGGRGSTDETILNELLRLINNAPDGSTIQGGIHSITGGDVGKALLNAQNDRHVKVRIVMDGKVAPDKYESADKKYLEQLDYKYCGKKGTTDRNGCLSDASSSNMHAKFFTFTKTKDAKGALQSDVSWFTSSNLTGESGTRQFNNAVTVYGDVKLRSGLDSFFSDLRAGTNKVDDYFSSSATAPRGYKVGDSATMFASPEKQTDMVADQLNLITPDSTCRVRLGQSMALGRPKLVSAVKRLKTGGCKVWMVVGSKDDPDRDQMNITKSTYDDLRSVGVDIKRRPDVHDKLILTYAKYGTSYAYRVYAGSQNWSDPGLNDNDELFVAMAPEAGSTHPLYDAYYDHFNDAYNRGKDCGSKPFDCG